MGIIYLAAVKKLILEEYLRVQPNKKLNFLYTFGNGKEYQLHKIPEFKDSINSIICDSGTFSKNSKSKVAKNISLESFMKMCKEPSSESFDYTLNYDEDFTNRGFKKNHRNMRILHDNGINVVPVVHNYSANGEIKFYIKERYPIIALGALRDKNNKNLRRKNDIIRLTFMIINAGLKVHLLGETKYHVLKEIPFTFCDSSTWSRCGSCIGDKSYGYLKWWNPEENKTNNIYMLDKIYSEENKKNHIGNYKYKQQFFEYLDVNFGLDIEDLKGFRRTFFRRIVNMHYYVMLQDIIKEEHRQRGFL